MFAFCCLLSEEPCEKCVIFQSQISHLRSSLDVYDKVINEIYNIAKDYLDDQEPNVTTLVTKIVMESEKKAKEVSFSKEKEDSRKVMEQEKLARQQAYASSSKQRYQTESSNIASKYHIKSSELKSQHERNMYFLNKREEALKK